MKKIVPVILFLSICLLNSWAQDKSWAVYAIIHSSGSDIQDPCNIKYCLLEEDASQSADNLTSSQFVPIYQNLNYENAVRLRDLHSPEGGNLPDNVVKFSSCQIQTDRKSKKKLFQVALKKAKEEFEKKGVLYFVGQGAKALASSGMIKDDKTNEILKTMGRIKIKIPISLGKRHQTHHKRLDDKDRVLLP